VGAGDQLAGGRWASGGLKVQDEDLLVAVEGEVSRMVLQPVARRRLDLDHFGFEVAQQHGRHGSRDALTEVGDADATVGGHWRPPLALRRRALWGARLATPIKPARPLIGK